MDGEVMTSDELARIRRRLNDVLPCDDAVRLLALVDHLQSRLCRLERVVGLAYRFVTGLGGARLRKKDFESFDPLLRAMNDLTMAEMGKCLDLSAKAE